MKIQPEINDCAQTYGYPDVGDVFGISSSINYGFKLKREDPNSAMEITHQSCHLFSENETPDKNNNEKVFQM